MEALRTEKLNLSPQSYKIFQKILDENPRFEEIVRKARNWEDMLGEIKSWILEEIRDRPWVLEFYESKAPEIEKFKKLSWNDYGAIRLLDYIDHSGEKFEDLNIPQKVSISYPFKNIWLAFHKGAGGAKPAFFEDMLHLFR